MSSPTLYPKFHAFDPSTGLPLVGGKLYTYVAGTTTPQATYSDSALTVANANPVTLDANGEAVIFVGPLSYKLVLQKSDGSAVWTFDNYAPNLASNELTSPEWLPLTGTLAFVSATQFKVMGADVTGTLSVGRRLKTTNSGGTVYSTIVASSFATDTSITVVNDSGVLDSGLSAVAYGIVSFANPSYLDPRSAVSAYLTADVGPGFAALTQVTGFTEDVDALGEFAAGVFTAKYPGKYRVTWRTQATDTAATITFYAVLKVNGATYAGSGSFQPSANGYTASAVEQIVSLAAGGTITFWFQSGSATTTLRSQAAAVSARATSLVIERIP